MLLQMTTPETLQPNGEPDEDNAALDFRDIILWSFLALIILITILGNTLIIAAVATTRRLRTVTNYFVVSLAASDLMVGALVMPLAVAKEIAGGRWLFGPIACELWISMDVMLCTASILNLCCISLDRYFAITSPLAYTVKRSVRLSLLMIGAVWVVSAIITCPPMFGLNDRPHAENSTDCGYSSNPGYVVYSALGSFYIPAIIMVYVYWRIFAVARKRQAVLMQGSSEEKRETQGSDSNSSTGGDANTHNNEGPQIVVSEIADESVDVSLPALVRDHNQQPNDKRRSSCSSLLRTASLVRSKSLTSSFKRFHYRHSKKHHYPKSEHDCPDSQKPSDITSEASSNNSFHCQYCSAHKEQRPLRFQNTIRKKEGYERAAFQRERRVAKSLSVVVGGFIVCWLPFFIVYVIEPFCESCYFHPVLHISLVWLGWINSAINPLIYAFNSQDFKKAFIRLTIGKCRCYQKTRKSHDPQQFI